MTHRGVKPMTKYYYLEHEAAYDQIERDGKSGWDELHGGTGFEDFSSRAFLGWALDALQLPPAETSVLEYGCGTGPGACFLAARGYVVDAIDLIPRAITLARRFATERGLTIHFAVQDICTLTAVPPRTCYDLIVDSYCLQSVVLDEDRRKLFAAVHARLKAGGHYLISTAMFDPDRCYDDAMYDEESGVVYSRLEETSQHHLIEGTTQLGGTWYLPHRRHLKPAALAAELQYAGFRVLWQGGENGSNVICARDAPGPR
jgi:SAM-dependent methyltransferase